MKPNGPGQELSPRVFHIASDSTTFSEYYDEVQEWLKLMAGMDQLLPGPYVTKYYTYLYCMTIVH